MGLPCWSGYLSFPPENASGLIPSFIRAFLPLPLTFAHTRACIDLAPFKGAYTHTHAPNNPTETLARLAEYCSEFLVHAADVEGLCQGIDGELVTGRWREWARAFRASLHRFPVVLAALYIG